MASDPETKRIISLFSSVVFRVTAQNGNKSFFVHGGLLSKSSRPFRSIVDANQRKTSKREINLNDWDEDTVGRLIDFLYTENYSWPGGGLGNDFLESRDELEPTTFFRAERPLTPIKRMMNYKRVLSMDYHNWVGFQDEDGEIFGKLFLAHAKVYALAKSKEIWKLRELAISRLLETLESYYLAEYEPRQIRYIAELLEYVYKNTDSPSGSSEPEPMRRAVIRFATLQLTKLNAGGQISNLVRENGELAVDLLSDVTRRIKLAETGGVIKHKYLAGLEVRSDDKQPANCVQEYRWKDPNINFERTYERAVWLVPYYTQDKDKACTSFKVIWFGDEGYDPRFKIPVTNDPGEQPCLKPVTDENISLKVSRVQLVRTGIRGKKMDEIVRKFNAAGVTDDIMGPASDAYIYLMWK